LLLDMTCKHGGAGDSIFEILDPDLPLQYTTFKSYYADQE